MLSNLAKISSNCQYLNRHNWERLIVRRWLTPRWNHNSMLIGIHFNPLLLSQKIDLKCLIRQSGLRLKKEKCVFMKDSVIYLGIEINRRGISPVADKIIAILEAPKPKNVSELKAF